MKRSEPWRSLGAAWICSVCHARPKRVDGDDCVECHEAWKRAQRSPGFLPTVELFDSPQGPDSTGAPGGPGTTLPPAPEGARCEANMCRDCGGSLSVSCPRLASREANNHGPMYAEQLDLFRATQTKLHLEA